MKQIQTQQYKILCFAILIFHIPLRKREAWYAIHVRKVSDSKQTVIKNVFNMQPFANILHVIFLLAAPALGEYEVTMIFS